MLSSNVEDYIKVNLPDYEGESSRVVKIVIGVALFWVFVLPSLASRPVEKTESAAEEVKGKAPPTEASPTPTTKVSFSSSSEEKRFKKKKKTTSDGKNAKAKSGTNSPRRGTTAATTQEEVPPARYIPLWANVLSLTGLLCSVVYVLFTNSPYNYFTPRRIFQAPLLTRDECQHVIAMAELAAQKNIPDNDVNSSPSSTNNTTANPLLQEPLGWQKTRHRNYPTTDLNLVTDPFTKEDRAWLRNLLDRRLAPSLERFFGIPPSAIRMNDLFVVRYDAGKQAHLANHTDDADISFNILLTEDFEGGGTRFWNRITRQPFAHVEPTTVGTGLMHGAQINHEGYHVSKGTRMILVGFTNIDRFDPWTGQSTGLSWMASWLSMAWVHIRFRAGYFLSVTRLETGGQPTKAYDAQFFRLLFRDLINILQWVGDNFLTHAVTTVVDSANTTAYLQALDAEYEARGKYKPKANWFKGQNVDLDVVSGWIWT
eukprot:scaffold5828_cov168-Amphora_coffeaeformis.AAC.22